MHLLPFIVAVLFCVIAVYFASVRARQRTRRWQQLAASLGCTVTQPSPAGLWGFSFGGLFANPVPLPGMHNEPLFQRGRDRRIPNLMTGEYEGQQMECFDYRYTIGSGRDSRTYHFMCLILPSPVPLQSLHVRPESTADRVLGLIGVHGIQFESAEFNRLFHVECGNPRFAFDVLNPQAMELLVSSRYIGLEGSAGEVLFYESRQHESHLGFEGTVNGMLRLGTDFLKLVPQYLTHTTADHQGS